MQVRRCSPGHWEGAPLSDLRERLWSPNQGLELILVEKSKEQTLLMISLSPGGRALSLGWSKPEGERTGM